MEDLPLGRNAALVPEFVVKDLQNTDDDDDDIIILLIKVLIFTLHHWQFKIIDD